MLPWKAFGKVIGREPGEVEVKKLPLPTPRVKSLP
jgi:hypothetical protein